MLRKASLLILLFTMCIFQIKSQNKKAENNSVAENILPSGKFVIGANYWASHASPAMWSDWRPDIVEQDLKKLSEAGIKTLRVFPLWPVFQPLTVHRAFQGSIQEYRFGEDPLPETPAGRAGVDVTAISKFKTFVALAEKNDIKLVVSLLTGWMSGRLFVPPALDGLNLLTDPEAVKWEIRYIKYFVSEFRNSPSIIAWDLGNECNCMSPVSPSEQWVWISTIADAIKATDHSRPVISGIASRISEKGPKIQDTGENLDILTTHFYHTFTPYAELEALNTIRPVLAPVVENLINEDVSGKACFIEEMGTLGPLFGDDGPDGVKPGFLRSNLFSAWAHNCRGLFWWIAFNQGHLNQTPFDWNSRGSEYGLWYPDGVPKPVLTEIQKFSQFLSGFDYASLPERIIDGV
jgi:endo-1,4-beta-mannosidase